MVHVLDILLGVTSQLNSLNKDYNGKGNARVVGIPDFAIMCIDRMIDVIPEFCKDPNKSIDIEKTIFISGSTSFTPTYLVSVRNAAKVVVDKMPTIINHKNDVGPGIVTLIVVPADLFDENTDIKETVNYLKNIYLGIVDEDPFMKYKASISLLKYYNDPRINIPMYDIEMILIAICCMNINTKSWFQDNKGLPVSPKYTLDAFTDKQLPDDVRDKVYNVLKKCNSVNDLRNSIQAGKIIKHFLSAK